MRILNFQKFIQMNESELLHTKHLLGKTINEEDSKVYTYKMDNIVFDFTNLYALLGIDVNPNVISSSDKSTERESKIDYRKEYSKLKDEGQQQDDTIFV